MLDEKLINAYHNKRRDLARALNKQGKAIVHYHRYRCSPTSFDLEVRNLTEEQVIKLVEKINDDSEPEVTERSALVILIFVVLVMLLALGITISL